MVYGERWVNIMSEERKTFSDKVKIPFPSMRLGELLQLATLLVLLGVSLNRLNYVEKWQNNHLKEEANQVEHLEKKLKELKEENEKQMAVQIRYVESSLNSIDKRLERIENRINR